MGCGDSKPLPGYEEIKPHPAGPFANTPNAYTMPPTPAPSHPYPGGHQYGAVDPPPWTNNTLADFPAAPLNAPVVMTPYAPTSTPSPPPTPSRIAAGVHDMVRRASESPDQAYSDIEERLESGDVDVNAVDLEGKTALHIAAQLGLAFFIELLLGKGARTDIASAEMRELPLHEAVRSGDLDAVKSLLPQGQASAPTASDLNSKNHNGYTPLALALCGAKDEQSVIIVEALLRAGSDPSILISGTGTLLHLMVTVPAMEGCFVEAVELGADPRVRDVHGQTPLHLAAQLGKESLVEFMLQDFADMASVRDRNGRTALDTAQANDKPNIVARLSSCVLKNAADSGDILVLMSVARTSSTSMMSSLDSESNTALHLLAGRGHSRALEALMEAGFVDNCLALKNAYGDTPLHKIAENGHTEMAQCVMARPSCQQAVEMPNSDGYTPLHLAVRQKHFSVVQEILNGSPFQVAVGDSNTGNTALHFATLEADLQTVELLLTRGADVNARNNYQETPLHFAATWNQTEVVHRLLDCGADPLAVNNVGRTPLEAARRRQNFELWDAMQMVRLSRATTAGDAAGVRSLLQEDSSMKLLLDHRDPESGETVLHVAARTGKAEIIAIAAQHLPNPAMSLTTFSETGDAPLHAAARTGECGAIKQLLAISGADPNLQNGEGETALHVAAAEGWVDAIATLVENGADVNARASRGNTALHDAACNCNLLVVKVLLAVGADPNASSTTDGGTPLHLVTQWGPVDSKAVVKELLDSGADPNALNNEGKKPAELAENPNRSVIMLLAPVVESKESQYINEELNKEEANGWSLGAEAGVAGVPAWQSVQLNNAPSAPDMTDSLIDVFNGIKYVPPFPEAEEETLPEVTATPHGYASPPTAAAPPQSPDGRLLGAVRVTAPHVPPSPFSNADLPPMPPSAAPSPSLPPQPSPSENRAASSAAVPRLSVSGGTSLPSIPSPTMDDLLIPHELVKFDEEARLGQGSFGKVYRGTWSGVKVAIKVLHGCWEDMDAEVLARELAPFRKEVAMMATLRHDNIQALRGYCMIPKVGPAIISKYYARGSLAEILKQGLRSKERERELTWGRRLKMALDLAHGMTCMHSRPEPIVHRDLKAINCFLDEHWNALVGDFGLTREVHARSSIASSTAATNPRWMAPELLLETSIPYTTKSDVYSFAMVLYEMLVWRVPWYDHNNNKAWEIINRIGKGERPHVPDQLPGLDNKTFQELGAYIALMQKCWAQLPEERPDFDEIVSYLDDILGRHKAAVQRAAAAGRGR